MQDNTPQHTQTFDCAEKMFRPQKKEKKKKKKKMIMSCSQIV